MSRQRTMPPNIRRYHPARAAVRARRGRTAADIGYAAGLAAGAAPGTSARSRATATIVHGSQTGNGRRIARPGRAPAGARPDRALLRAGEYPLRELAGGACSSSSARTAMATPRMTRAPWSSSCPAGAHRGCRRWSSRCSRSAIPAIRASARPAGRWTNAWPNSAPAACSSASTATSISRLRPRTGASASGRRSSRRGRPWRPPGSRRSLPCRRRRTGVGSGRSWPRYWSTSASPSVPACAISATSNCRWRIPA